MTGYHSRWVRPPEQADDPERIAIREALAFGKAVYDQRCALGLISQAGPGQRRPPSHTATCYPAESFNIRRSVRRPDAGRCGAVRPELVVLRTCAVSFGGVHRGSG
jgi:hypothetical protein